MKHIPSLSDIPLRQLDLRPTCALAKRPHLAQLSYKTVSLFEKGENLKLTKRNSTHLNTELVLQP